MKTIINLILFSVCYFYLIFFVNAEFTICNYENINFSIDNNLNLCKEGAENININDFEFNNGKYINMDLGFWGTNNNLTKEGNIGNDIVIGFFNNFVNTKIKKVDINYDSKTGFLGINNNYNNYLNSFENLPLGFFDNTKKTMLNMINPNFLYPVGFLGNFNLENNKKGGSNKNKIITYTYREYFEFIFKKNSDLIFSNSKYSYHEYDKLINNLIDLYLVGLKDSNNIISTLDKNRINLYVENNKYFNENLFKLMQNLRLINIGFSNLKTDKEKFYMIDYYLNIE